MALRVNHATVVTTPDSGDGKVSTTAWNDAHVLTGTANMLVGFDGTGVGAEIDPATITSGSVVDGDKGEVTIASGVWSLDANAVNIVNKAQHVADRTALSTAATGVPVAYLRETGREGVFVWSSANNATNVTNDPGQGVYVAPATDTTGATGAWIRKYTGATNVKWFGATGDGATNDYTAVQRAINTIIAVGGGTVYFPAGGTYLVNTGLVITSTIDAFIPLRLEGGGATYLKTNSAIDILTISNTSVSGNTRFIAVNNLGFTANNAGARGIVLSNASYNQFTNLDMLGGGTAITCGVAINNRNIGNQFDNIRITQPGNGIYISGIYNLFTNIQINEGITGAYAIYFAGQYCVVDGFVARGVGGTGGTATVVLSNLASYSMLANGTVIDSYAIGVFVQGETGQKVKGVNIINSQTHGLQLNGTLASEIDVTIANSSLATANTYNHIDCLNTPTDCTIRAQFQGTQALLDINEANGTNNTWICGTLPNGKTISGTSTVAVSAGNVRAASYNVGATLVLNTSGVLQAAAVPAFAGGDVTSAGGSLALTIGSAAVSLAKMANLAANSILGNNTGSPATPLALTAAQTKTLLAIANTDVSGLGTASTAATGTSGHTLPFLDGANTFSNDLVVYQHNLFLNDVSTFGGFGGNGNGRAWATTVGGFNLAGQGSSYDLSLTNKSGTTAIRIPTGTTNAEVVGSLAVGGATVFNSSGVLQAAAFPALTGDVTTSAGALATTLATNIVTYAKFQQVAASSLVGNATGSLANATGITLAGGLAFSGSTLTAAGALTPTSVASTGAITSSSATAGIGYATGAGGAVTQLTSKSTAPPAINKVCGQITMNNAALAAAAKVSFAVSNTSCAATDIPQVAVVSGGTANAYRANVTAVAASSFTVTVENITAGSLSEAPVIGFFINKAVTS